MRPEGVDANRQAIPETIAFQSRNTRLHFHPSSSGLLQTGVFAGLQLAETPRSRPRRWPGQRALEMASSGHSRRGRTGNGRPGGRRPMSVCGVCDGRHSQGQHRPRTGPVANTIR